MKKFFKDFKAFISRGNVLDLAVATIIGASFSQIVSSFTNGIIMPLVSLLFKAENLDKLVVELRPAETAMVEGVETIVKPAITWQYGTLIQAIINFVIVALFLFILIRIISKARNTLDVNAQMCVKVQAKLDKDEELTDFEAKWLKRYTKKNPDTAPKKVVVEVKEPEPVKPTTDDLLAEILVELKKQNESKGN